MFVGIVAFAAMQRPPVTAPQKEAEEKKATPKPQPKSQPKLSVEEEVIPDSLLNPRWKIKKTAPVLISDLDSFALDLKMPDNILQRAEYNDSLNLYFVGSKIGDTYLNAPLLMTPEEYNKWSERRQMKQFFRQKDAENVASKGKEKFSFSDMHFDLGPAEKIFGPGGVRIKTQGTAELRIGMTTKDVDNPSLPIRNRKTKSFDFDEKINLNLNGKVGDKVNMNLNYNTDATFDWDTKNIKLRYEGKEDEIIKLVEAGNVTFPSNSSLIKGASSLFGIRTDFQFGKLKLQTVLSQKNSTTKSVSSRGGTQFTPFEIDVADYEENRHFFLSHYFRERYDRAMASLPNLTTGVKITRVEVWVTNKTGNTSNTRNVVALTDLGEGKYVKNNLWGGLGDVAPSNAANSQYNAMVNEYAAARNIEQTNTVLDAISGFTGGIDYEKVQSARLLSSSEYTVNSALGYISLKTTLQTDQILAVAYEYTLNGQTYQVGEFASDNTNTNEAIFVKSLKNTNNSPQMGNWRLMMKNVYYLASTVEKTKFRLDVKYQSDTTGVYLTYLPEPQVKDRTLIKVLGADRLDNNNKPNSNGYFDFVEGYTVSNGRVFFPAAEPFGAYLKNYLVRAGVTATTADKYAFTELYDTTKTAAKQIAEKDKFVLMGQFKGTAANVISLGAYNVPQGSVVVTAGGVVLTEGSDYSVDYSAGEVTILNQSIIDAGTSVNVSLESNTEYGQMRKTMMGLNWEYDFTKDFQIGGTFQHLSEQAQTSKVAMGSEPLNNILWGLNMNFKKESQWLTNMLDAIPFLHCTQPSQISFTGEFAHLIAGQAGGTQDDASYIDDFENTKNGLDISEPKQWVLSSVPTMFPEHGDKDGLSSGYNRSLLAWYNIDPLFTYRSSSLTPSHIKSDLEQLSNHYVREVYVSELYPNRDQSTYNGATSTLPILNLAYYPTERGPYNFTTTMNADGTLSNPATKWGGMMRKLDTNDFEAANIEYVEFWLLDPFIYTRNQADASSYGGDLYINLGEVSEDILRDGKKFYESGMPVDGTSSFANTQWGKIPVQATQTYAFATTSGSREKQDVGLNGLTDAEEKEFPEYMQFNSFVSTIANDSVRNAWTADPANDNYQYFRGSALDERKASILERYKRINNPQGNSPDSDGNNESYDTSYKTMPDVEDINQDYTLNEYERYYQYRVSIRPEDLREENVGNNYLADIRESSVRLRNGNTEVVKWYKFRIPVNAREKEKVGSISDFTSIRFMRMFLTDFQKPIVLRFGSLDLVRGEWRVYEQNLSNTASSNSGTLEVSAVNIEEYNDKQPVNYVLPPGISRVTDPSQPQLVEANEQALNMTVKNLSKGEAKAVYKNTTLDLRQYKRLQMFVHANAFKQNTTNLQNDQLAVFVRLGSDYKSNYYEYEIPLKLTPEGQYDKYSSEDCRMVWPEENMVDIDLSVFTAIKKARNMSKAAGSASYNTLFSEYDADKPSNKISVMGNPSLGEVKTMIIGVRNISPSPKSGEVWVNELRLLEFNNSGGWAASGALNMQLSDFGTVNLTGKMITEGFGGLEDGIAQRSTDDYKTYSFTANLELGKFFPDKAKVSAPLYYSVTKEETRPKYNPLDTDMELDDALEALTSQERDSVESIAVTKTTNTNFSLSNVRVGIKTKRHPMPYDPANFSFSYSHSHRRTSGETTVYEKEDQWRGSLNYSYTPVYKTFEPFKKLKGKSKWLNFPKALGFNYLPQNITFNSEIMRNYYELQERDMESMENSQLPLTFSEQFLWNREFSMRWDFTKNLHMNFQSATHAEIEEPYVPVNKDLYPDQYQVWKDSISHSIRNLGTPLDYQQSFTASYQLPLNKLPIFDWLNADASYSSNYSWVRGTELDNGTSLGNTITTNRNLNINSTLNMETLYNHIPFLKKANERFKKSNNQRITKKPTKVNSRTKANEKDKKETKDDKAAEKEKKVLPKNKNTYQREITLKPDTTVLVTHSKKSKRLIVSAKTADGKPYKLKYKVVDDNKILVKNQDTVKIKISVTPKEPLDKQWWYSPAQHAARFLMMVRSVGISYRNQYSMTLPGFIPNVGDAFGQRTGGVMSPGVDFAFGFIDDSYLNKAYENNWLLCNDSVATPATTNSSEDLQIRMTLEPIRDLKIDLNASRTVNKARSIQYMYSGMPTTQSGTFTMTTVSLKSALEGMGDANNGYHSNSFNEFCQSIDGFRDKVQAQYANTTYPEGLRDAQGVNLGGTAYNPELGTVNKYSADVLIPAFLSAYTSGAGSSLDIFPTLKRLLPNWTIKYSGLGKLPWLRDHFKSVNLNHSYKSVYAVGSYASYSTYHEYMNGLGFINDTKTGNPIPNSMYNVSTVSINEAFSPLLGIDFTLNNNLTCKMEYRTTRVLNLSMTSIQINEALSKDWVIGLGYKISNFQLFSNASSRKIKKAQRGGSKSSNQQSSTTTRGRSGVNHDLNLRLDISYRNQAAITRDIATMTSSASSGNSALKISFMADYTLSRLLTVSAYYDRQTNTPLLSSSSYPTTTQDFGFSFKFSLTR
ncbi:MAG: cell surface protein SprA [Prevotella sp.]|nr:cell surface protein SprA [Prevotella sp.]